MKRANGDDAGEIETGDVIQRGPPGIDDDPGVIEVIDNVRLVDNTGSSTT